MRPPVTYDPISVLLAYHHWATRRVLDLCRRLSRAQFHQSFDIGPGSLHDTLTHIIECMRAWTDRIAARPARPPIERYPDTPAGADDARDRTVAELSALFDAADDDLRRAIESTRHDLAGHVYADLGGTTRYTFTRGAAIVHVLSHGTHHRAQCLNTLRRLKVPGLSDRLPDLDVNDWQYETECKTEEPT